MLNYECMKLFENFDLSRASGGKKVAGRETSGENAIRCRALKGRKIIRASCAPSGRDFCI
jgi:hypothetical protein